MSSPNPPLILCCSGLDPTGGAGIQADIEAIGALGGHALPVITALTVQDCSDVHGLVATDAELIERQINTLAAQLPIATIKLGLLGSVEQIAVISAFARRAGLPLVLDPVLKAGGGTSLSTAALRAAVREELLPLTEIATPNLDEARTLLELPDEADAPTCAQRWQSEGCRQVLVTGGDQASTDVANFYLPAAAPPARTTDPSHAGQWFRWPRLPGQFHGSGCTLASAITVLLARGIDAPKAVFRAQAWTHQALQNAFQPPAGQALPRRWPQS